MQGGKVSFLKLAMKRKVAELGTPPQSPKRGAGLTSLEEEARAAHNELRELVLKIPPPDLETLINEHTIVATANILAAIIDHCRSFAAPSARAQMIRAGADAGIAIAIVDICRRQ